MKKFLYILFFFFVCLPCFAEYKIFEATWDTGRDINKITVYTENGKDYSDFVKEQLHIMKTENSNFNASGECYWTFFFTKNNECIKIFFSFLFKYEALPEIFLKVWKNGHKILYETYIDDIESEPPLARGWFVYKSLFKQYYNEGLTRIVQEPILPNDLPWCNYKSKPLSLGMYDNIKDYTDNVIIIPKSEVNKFHIENWMLVDLPVYFSQENGIRSVSIKSNESIDLNINTDKDLQVLFGDETVTATCCGCYIEGTELILKIDGLK